MTREPDKRARRVVLPLGERSTLTIDAFPGYTEFVELHVEFAPGTRVEGYPPLDLAGIVERFDTLIRARQIARQYAEVQVEMADELEELLGPYLIKPLSRDVDDVAREMLTGRVGEVIFADAREGAARRARRRSGPLRVDMLEAICAYWDEVYDDYVGREGERRMAVANHFGLGERRLGTALKEARLAGLKYRGMR